MRKRYRRFVLGLYRKLRHPRVLKQSRFRRWFARHFLDKTVWKPTRHTFAGGVAAGMFAMMLVIPGQMPIAAVLAAIFRVNIPVAAIVTWITNPVTMAPVAWWEVEFGNWFIRTVGMGTPPELDWHHLKEMLKGLSVSYDGVMEAFSRFKPWVASLYVGGVGLGLLLAPVGYALSFVLWDLLLLLTHRRSLPEPPPPPPPPPSPPPAVPPAPSASPSVDPPPPEK